MVCLLLLYNPKGIFGFVQITRKKNKKLLTRALHGCHSATFWRQVRLAQMFVTVILLHYFIYLVVLFRFGWRVCGGSV
jgi:hypothetical protein